MSLEEVMSKIKPGQTTNAVDAVMKLMDEQSALMHTEINQPQLMNALLIMRQFCLEKNYPKSAKFWETLYKAQVVHMVTYKRQRPKELVKVLTATMAAFGLNENKEKSGWLGTKK